ncbi:hypothetical protein VTJ04DRAFT_6663 [Mycothermus thermophilus]|uniref:uncharacterized protein n=1 Tax=Humicola insolens TaxID=85995 RepID=UPI00374308DB
MTTTTTTSTPTSTPAHAILDGLNPAQRKAVSSDAPTLAILAGPGSGKTHTLTARVVWLIDHVGLKPEDVLVATFTVKAAREMKERIARTLADGREKKLILGTFHSIARRYLAAYGRHIGLPQSFGIADDADSRAIITRICKRLQIGLDPAYARAWISKKKAKGAAADSSQPKARGAATDPNLQELETCYREYQKHLETSNLLDYDDLLVRCVELLRKFPRCVSNIQAVLVDEYQDTNAVQYDLMTLFAQQRRRITIVGDPDQSIYGWRSADIRNLERLLRDYPGTECVALEQNYRSSQSILGMSLAVIQQDEKRYKKSIKAVHSKGCRPVLRRLKNPAVEADWIVAEIRRVLLMSGSMMTHNDVAILLRSASLSRHIESALGRAGILYRMVGGFKFYERAEIKTIIDYLRVIHQPENNDALARIINVPRRGIGDVTVKNLLEEAETSGLSVWAVLTKHCQGNRTAKTKITKQAEQKISGGLLRPLNDLRKKMGEPAKPNDTPFGLVQLIDQLLTTLKFEQHLRDTHPDDHEQRWANVQEFLSLAADFERELDRLGDDEELPDIEGLEQTKESDTTLQRFLANVSLAADAQTGGDEQQSKPLVTISTIHAAKGLEWPVVFIPAVYDKSIPHARSEDDDEERRLLYVAMTRAQSLLYLSYPVSGSNGERTAVSPFVETIQKWFYEKGPCLDRPVMEEIAKILRRTLPPDQEIFSALPDMFSIEDNLFPINPDEAHDANNEYNTSGNEPQRKRPRLQHSSSSTSTNTLHAMESLYQDHLAASQHRSSQPASLPGFVSVGTHHAAITAANAHTETPVQKQKKSGAAAATTAGTKRSATGARRQAGQTSILGFVRSNSLPNDSTTSSGAGAKPPPSLTRGTSLPRTAGGISTSTNKGLTLGFAQQQQQQVQQQQEAQGAIDPHLLLTSHRLNTGKPALSRPTVPRGGETTPPKGKRYYACFSSSPTQHPPAGNEGGGGSEVENTAVDGVGAGAAATTDTGGSSNSGGGGGGGGDASAPFQPPATAAFPKPKGLGVGLGLGGGSTFRRPAGFVRPGPGAGPGLGGGQGDAMQRLRRPFKPLTINGNNTSGGNSSGGGNVPFQPRRGV